MQLYTYEESGNSYKVRLLMSFLQLECERIEVDLMQDIQHQPEFLAVNPRGEVPVLVDKNGLQPTKIGKLPPQLAAVMQTNINVQSLTVEAALTGKRKHIYHAAMMDPHTAAELDLDQIYALVDDLIEAHDSWLPEYN